MLYDIPNPYPKHVENTRMKIITRINNSFDAKGWYKFDGTWVKPGKRIEVRPGSCIIATYRTGIKASSGFEATKATLFVCLLNGKVQLLESYLGCDWATVMSVKAKEAMDQNFALGEAVDLIATSFMLNKSKNSYIKDRFDDYGIIIKTKD